MEPKICRVCLEKKATINVFDKQDEMQYCTKIMKFVNVKIVENDGFPQHICSGCADELNIGYEFVSKCESADSALRGYNTELCDAKINVLKIKEEILKLEPDDDICIDSDFLLDEPNQKVVENCDKKRKHVRKKRNKSKSEPTQCIVCGLLVASPSAMEIHMRTHTGEKPFICSICDTRYRTKGALKRHNEVKHTVRERKFTCETCGNNFFTKNDIITHLRVHTQEAPYVCPFCSRQFKQISSLIRHKRTHTGEKPYSCPICDKKFLDSNLVKKHLSVHTNEKNYTCHLCSKSVKSKASLSVHIKTIHSNEKHNVCSFCGMTFSMKGNLSMHIKRRHSPKSGECVLCRKTFSDLEVHMRKHTGEKPFICGVCSHAFATKRSLAHHMVFKHKNASKFKCSIGDCLKTFPTVMMLEFHLLKQHTNHTPYVCQHCSRGFFRTCDLSRHLRVSHMDLQIKMPIKTLIS